MTRMIRTCYDSHATFSQKIRMRYTHVMFLKPFDTHTLGLLPFRAAQAQTFCFFVPPKSPIVISTFLAFGAAEGEKTRIS